MGKGRERMDRKEARERKGQKGGRVEGKDIKEE